MTEHVTRITQRELIDRLNHLERTLPIYRAALERIADHEQQWPAAAAEARLALREADWNTDR